jgi:hypothetical protein
MTAPQWYAPIVIGAAVVLICFGFVAIRHFASREVEQVPDPVPSKVATNSLVGFSEQEIIEKYGPPSRDRPGYQALGMRDNPNMPSGAVRTLVFDDISGGTLWVWINQVSRDEWRCFESCWFAKSVRF